MSGGPELLTGGRKHEHVEPDYDHPNAVAAYDVRWNTVARTSCGHLYVRRHSFGFLIPLGDHYPQWNRLRPWHVVACLKVAGRVLRRGGRAFADGVGDLLDGASW